MKLCKTCQSELLIDISLSGRSVRCPICGSLTETGSSNGKAESHRRAWWCFGLGVACLPLLVISFAFAANRAPWPSVIICGLSFIFGMTAIYSGIVAMSRMRYRKATPATKIAAVVGSLSGGCFGLMLSGLIGVITLIAFVIMQSSESTNEPEAAYVMYRKMAHIDIPEDSMLKPYAATSSPMMFGRVDFRDNEDSQKSNAWFRIARFPKWTTVNRGQFNQIVHDDIYGMIGRTGLTKLGSNKLKWNVEDRKMTINKNTWKQVNTNMNGKTKEREFVQYFVLSDNGELTHGLLFVHDESTSNFTEDDVKQIFETFKSRQE